jgi:hypothetical protein
MSAGDQHCGADAAAYVLGALEPAEAEAFRRHLAACTICQDELVALRGVADSLALAAPQRRPPPELRRRLMRAVRAEQRAAGGQAENARRRRRRPPAAFVRAALATGLAVVLALAVLGAVNLFAGSPTSRTIDSTVIGSAGRAQLQRSGSHAELVLNHFPAPPPGHVYEVWLGRAGHAPAPTSALFSVTAAGTGDVAIPGDLRGVSEVLVTPEPDGGSQAPTHAPVIVAQLSAVAR